MKNLKNEAKTNKIKQKIDKEYLVWIETLKNRYKGLQIKASIKVNEVLIRFNWLLGRDIVRMRAEKRWGDRFYINLSNDLKKAFPNSHGFSPTNLNYMKRFYILFSNYLTNTKINFNFENKFCPQLGGELFCLPWGHIKLIVDKCSSNQNKALFYLRSSIKNNWSRAILLNQISANLYERQGKAITNFEHSLPPYSSELAKEIIKDPYIFDFLEIKEDYNEKELKNSLTKNIEKYLLELGTGFAYMGNEYRVKIGNSEEYIDMLFYNTSVHAYVVIEIKIREFQPEDIGQLGTYVIAIDRTLKTVNDSKTIGLLICKEKNEVKANYALASSSLPLGVSSYELSRIIPENFKSSLPTIEEIENELNRLKVKENKD